MAIITYSEELTALLMKAFSHQRTLKDRREVDFCEWPIAYHGLKPHSLGAD